MTEQMKTVTEIVKWMLMNEIEARSDDQLLIALVDSYTNPSINQYPYTVVIKERYKFGLFPLASITRAARRVKAMYPELSPTEESKQARKARERDYKELSKARV